MSTYFFFTVDVQSIIENRPKAAAAMMHLWHQASPSTLPLRAHVRKLATLRRKVARVRCAAKGMRHGPGGIKYTEGNDFPMLRRSGEEVWSGIRLDKCT